MKLYILKQDCGDGSVSINFCIDPDVIKLLENGEYDSDTFIGGFYDGDGFTYETLFIPDGITLDELGINRYQLIKLSDFN